MKNWGGEFFPQLERALAALIDIVLYFHMSVAIGYGFWKYTNHNLCSDHTKLD